jgi:hypothetical protein
MSFADICIMASVLVVVVIVAKMLRAIRLLDGRVTLLQEEINHSRNSLQNPARKPVAFKPASNKTPIEGVPVTTPAPRPVRPSNSPDVPAEEAHYPGEVAAHVIEQEEADAIWAQLSSEQERLKKAMGRDFQVSERERKRSAAEIRGMPVVAGGRTLSAQEVAKKLERK